MCNMAIKAQYCYWLEGKFLTVFKCGFKVLFKKVFLYFLYLSNKKILTKLLCCCFIHQNLVYFRCLAHIRLLAHFRYPMRASSAAFRAAFKGQQVRIFASLLAHFHYLPLVLSKRQRSKKEGSNRQWSSRFLCKGVSMVLPCVS